MTDVKLEVRDQETPMWSVTFEDGEGTTLYVAGQNVRVLERRYDTWRIFDFVWMLHIMDYTGRQDFNNPLVIMAGSGGLWIALSGIWLLVPCFRLGEFVPQSWRPARELMGCDPDGNKLRSVESTTGDSINLDITRNELNQKAEDSYRQ